MRIAGLINVLAVIAMTTDTPVFRLGELQIDLFNLDFMPTGIEIVERSQLRQGGRGWTLIFVGGVLVLLDLTPLVILPPPEHGAQRDPGFREGIVGQ